MLVARGSLRPSDNNAAIEAEVERQLQERLKDGTVAAMDRDFVRKQIRERVKAQFQVVPPGAPHRWIISAGLFKARLRDKPLQLRIKFFVAQSAASGTYVGAWEIGPANGRRYAGYRGFDAGSGSRRVRIVATDHVNAATRRAIAPGRLIGTSPKENE